MSILQKCVILVAIPLVAQCAFLAVLLISRSDQKAAQRWALRSNEVIAQAEKCHRLILTAHTSMRGYALLQASFIAKEYQQTRQEIHVAVAELRELVRDDPEQQAKVDEIKSGTLAFIKWMDENMRLIESGKNTEVTKRIQTLTGANHLRELREKIDEFLDQESLFHKGRHEELDQAMARQDIVLISGIFAVLGSCGIFLVAFSRAISTRVNVLIDNTRRMAEGKELAPRLQGKDELGQIDHMFHRMAETIRQKVEENELFVYSVSHDLRSPLVNLQGFSQELAVVVRELREIILQSELSAPLKERIRILLDRDAGEANQFIHAAVQRLAGIIDALLRLSRAGRVEYRWQQVEVSILVERIVNSMRDSLAHKKAEVVLSRLPSCWGDSRAIEHIFANLIANASNYLDPARPGKIEVGCIEEESSAFRTYFVKDNGLGIPESLQPKVFVAFQRLHPQTAEGEGVGLTLVRRVVERHGGKIWLESTPGVGTTFFVSLPTSSEATLPAEQMAGTPISGKGDSRF